MLQRVMCGFATSISKFKNNPGAVLAEADGDAVAVSSHNQIQFYAVPAHLYEDMVQFVEMSQRGTAELNTAPGKFALTESMVDSMTEQLQNTDNDLGDFVECQNNS
ncbi:antitoxin of toxin-antitoxin stability system [Teredinibacter franksiae]|uniref:antitoxin of toxin-antitoxin stability system n=1 Tax=Teredinibacter franksiae TaxID=2761453 RepID=UPI001626FDD2|nr:antitoxin of toxin-antitoxin stability system [Teredinibacter franksiae]